MKAVFIVFNMFWGNYYKGISAVINALKTQKIEKFESKFFDTF